jgi:uncharacterized protein (DUF362 family)
MDMTRRDFLTLGGTAAAGFATGHLLGVSPLDLCEPETAMAMEVGAQVVPLDKLSVVSVAASGRVRKYGGSPTRYWAYSNSNWSFSAAGVLWKAIAALDDGGDPIAYLRRLVKPGGTVLIKPNWVEPSYWQRAKITHPSLVWAMAAMAAEAVGPSGKVIVGEGPASAFHWSAIVRGTNSHRTLAAQRRNGLPVWLADLNSRKSGWRKINLGNYSRFAGSGSVYYDGHSKSMSKMGYGKVGRYLLSSAVTRADLVIDFAKAKIHCSAGVTLALKNFLGVVPSNDGPYNDWRTKDVPHYSAYERSRGAKGIYLYNDTIGKTMADVHALARYVARDGSLQRTPQRNLLCIIDGIQVGGYSQHQPRPAGRGWIIAGQDPVACDHVGTRCMGFDPRKVHSLRAAKSGRLGLGTGDPKRVAVVYSGPGRFEKYFTRARRVQAEQVKAHWGHIIDLGRFDPGWVRAYRMSDTRVAFKGRPGLAVRLEYEANGHRYAQALRYVRTGVWAGEVPLNATKERIVAIDRHFNVAVRGV